MNVILGLLYFLTIVCDIVIFVDLRGLMLSFLLSKRNLKGAKKIHRSQSAFDRLTFNYVKNHTIHTKEYSLFHGVYLVFLCTLPIQYAVLITVNLLSSKAAIIVLSVLIILKFLLAIFLRFLQNSDRIFKFDKRYK